LFTASIETSSRNSEMKPIRVMWGISITWHSPLSVYFEHISLFLTNHRPK
jgi:hypothetical protein